MERVVVVGCGGAGKSTLARALGDRTGLPVVHLDRHYWNPGWVETPPPEWAEVHARLVARDRWILDGNYSGTLAARLARADTAVFLDYPTWRCLARALRRIARWRGRVRPDIAPHCPERLDPAFLRWIAGYRRRSRPRVLRLLDEGRTGAGLRVVRLRTPGQARRWLETAAANGREPGPEGVTGGDGSP